MTPPRKQTSHMYVKARAVSSICSFISSLKNTSSEDDYVLNYRAGLQPQTRCAFHL